NVRTPLNSPWVGAKLNLSSGIASAAGTKSFSSADSWRSMTIATVTFSGGLAAALGAGAVPCANAGGESAKHTVAAISVRIVPPRDLRHLVTRGTTEIQPRAVRCGVHTA